LSQVYETEHGALRRIADGERWLLCCPGCGGWGPLDDDMFHGRVSVDHATDGCPGGYHETHDFAAAVAVVEPIDAPIYPTDQWRRS
jgi:hypothetical protein